MFIYNSRSVGANIYTRPVHDRNISKKVVDKATSSVKSKVSKRNLKFLQALGLRVKT